MPASGRALSLRCASTQHVTSRWTNVASAWPQQVSRLTLLDNPLAVESTAERLLAQRHPGRPLRANVEFFTAVLLEAIGIPRHLFSAVFAIARTAGWCGHIAEQRATGRLIRPRARYVGKPPPQRQSA